MTGPSLERVIDALRQVTTEAATQSGQWHKFMCPVHEADGQPHSPSLGVKYDPQRHKTVVVCFARCPQEDVLAVANLRVRDLFDHLPDRARTGYHRPERPQQRPTPQPRPVRRERATGNELGAVVGPKRFVAAYTYTATTGEPLGRVLRYAIPHEHGVKKTFSQRRWDPEQRAWVPGGFAPILYRAQAVDWAIREGSPILVCEGEKDVDRAISAGYPATCNAGGAGKFGTEHAHQLRGAARVVIVADRDLPGFEHAVQVHDRLQGLVGRVDVMQPATGKDLSDHFDAGHSINDLRVIRPDQLAFVRPTPTDFGRGHGTGPRQPVEVSPLGRHSRRPDLDWGLDR